MRPPAKSARVTALALKTTPEYRDWLVEITDRESVSLSKLVKNMIEAWARSKKMPPPPPMRGMRDPKS